MPLKKGTSDATIKRNALEMIRAGHKPKQAWAAAYKMAGKYRKPRSVLRSR